MKFSVLLPTRNRLQYLKYAVESVRRQDYHDWEIIISDNCSEDDIHGFVSELGDDRIRYVKTSEFVPVTDNWNYALKHSDGDYVVMLGDDDGLLPGYFSTILKTLKDFPDPDFAYVGALFFAYPGVMPDDPNGFLRHDRNEVFNGHETAWLESDKARSVAQGYLDFRMPVASNMQFSLISRRMIDRLTYDGAFFHSPFPDFYATPLLFMVSNRILIIPQPLAIIGITPKSYGFYHFNNRPSAGTEFLNNGGQLLNGLSDVPTMLPGTSYNDSWLLANAALYRNHAKALGLKPNFANYRRLQIIHGYKHRYFDQDIDKAAFSALTSKMTVLERLTQGSTLAVAFTALRLCPFVLRDKLVAKLRKIIGQHSMHKRVNVPQPLQNLIEAFEYVAREPALIR
jgi:glycosyltransferase involved in cell wall biosynthesis